MKPTGAEWTQLLHGIDAVVVGGSWGAFQVLSALLPALPRELHVPVAVVLHLPSDSPGVFPGALGARAQVPVKEAEDKEPMASGTVYLAPAGYHLPVEADRSFALAQDEPVFFSRPSIDVLFESAADTFESGLLGVLLSGASEDGAAGLRAIQAAGGRVVVQDPESAESPIMPRAGIAACAPDAVADVRALTG